MNDGTTIIVGGPTACGKTSFAINLAKRIEVKYGLQAEIINADSVQMYDELKILTAYPSDAELAAVPHRLYGILNPDETSSIASWLDAATTEIDRIHNEGKTAIVCGGTGFYIRALLNGIANIPNIPEKVRTETKNLFDEIGRECFFEKLRRLDAESAAKLHKNDTQRILRAYEVASFTGKTLSEWWKLSKETANKAIRTIILLPSRERARTRAAERIRAMFARGAVDEVREFVEKYPNYDGPLQEVIGYREILDFLQKKLQNEVETMERIRVRTNQYIKRQSTWFRNQLKNAKFIEAFGDEVEMDMMEKLF